MHNAAHVHFHPSARDVSHATLQKRLPVFLNCTHLIFLCSLRILRCSIMKKTRSMGKRLQIHTHLKIIDNHDCGYLGMAVQLYV